MMHNQQPQAPGPVETIEMDFTRDRIGTDQHNQALNGELIIRHKDKNKNNEKPPSTITKLINCLKDTLGCCNDGQNQNR